MLDFLDILNGKFYQTYSGEYYAETPQLNSKPDSETSPMPFSYEYVDPMQYTYRQLISNLTETRAADVTVKTRENLPFKVGGVVRLEQGGLYTILAKTQDNSAASREAARFFAIPVGTEHILRLVEREDPYQL